MMTVKNPYSSSYYHVWLGERDGMQSLDHQDKIKWIYTISEIASGLVEVLVFNSFEEILEHTATRQIDWTFETILPDFEDMPTCFSHWQMYDIDQTICAIPRLLK